MMLLDSIATIFAPHHCLQCGQEGQMLCGECRQDLIYHPDICYRCHRLSVEGKTCASCRNHAPLRRVVVAHNYEGTLKDLIKAFKFGRAIAARTVLIDLLGESMLPLEYDLVTEVPSASTRQRQRGYNPARLLAVGLARVKNIPHASLLGRSGQSRQVGARRIDRLTQLENSVFPVSHRIAGQRILLVDDVMTTGATLAECARVLKNAGAKSIDAIVLARHQN